MPPDSKKIAEDVLALLYLTSFREKKDLPWRAWKGHDWDVLGRLFQEGLIFDPKNKNKSVAFTDEGYEKAKKLFETKYGTNG